MVARLSWELCGMTTDSALARLQPSVDLARDHISGPVDAPVTLVEYGDYECTHCQRAHRGILRVRDERLPGQLRYVFRHLPNRRLHEHATLAAEAAEAASAQGKFWEMHEHLFTHQQLDRDSLLQAAATMELDVERFARDLDEHTYAARVDDDLASAARSGANATPTFFVDGLRYDGPWDVESLHDAVSKPLGWRLRLLANQFAGLSASSSMLMLLGVVAALVWANSPWRDGYRHLWEAPLALGVAGHALNLSLHHWVNDGLVVIFFLVVGLEIRRELTVGELTSPRQAALPIAAAIGGMLCPALIYLLFNAGGEASHGWGVPMGTDTAFALGLLALLGRRVPLSLRVFVAAAAIADDVGSIVVIALFYTASIKFSSLGLALMLWGVALLLNRIRVYGTLPYAILGLMLWFAVLDSGVHPTLAGVLLAFAIPTRSAPNAAALLAQTESIFQGIEAPAVGEVDESRYQAAVRALEALVERLLSPAQRLARDLQPWSAYLVLPVFAFANAGIELSVSARNFLEPVSLGVMLGLFLGKPLGLSFGSWVAIRTGLATKPEDMGWRQIVGAGFLCGIGFTMAFFIAGVAFSHPQTLALAKLSTLAASVLAAIVGWTMLQFTHHLRLSGRASRADV
jgi:NhaA family Na+:H+ antiporter